MDAQRAQSTPPLSRTTRIHYDKTPDLISFGSKDDLCNGDSKEGSLHADSASDLEDDIVVSDTPL